jgi:hypothetical protein
MTKVHFTKATITQTTRFYREGSALAGTITGGPVELVAKVNIESDEPLEKIQRLVRLAEASCYAQQSMAQPMPVTTVATLNGAPIDL